VAFNRSGFSSPGGHCDTVDTPAPPPDPIENIYNTSFDVLNVLSGRTTQRVEVSVRLECILYESISTLFGVLHSLSFSWDEPELSYNVEPIQQYQAHLALEPLDPGSEADATAGFSVSSTDGMRSACSDHCTLLTGLQSKWKHYKNT